MDTWQRIRQLTERAPIDHIWSYLINQINRVILEYCKTIKYSCNSINIVNWINRPKIYFPNNLCRFSGLTSTECRHSCLSKSTVWKWKKQKNFRAEKPAKVSSRLSQGQHQQWAAMFIACVVLWSMIVYLFCVCMKMLSEHRGHQIP